MSFSTPTYSNSTSCFFFPRFDRFIFNYLSNQFDYKHSCTVLAYIYIYIYICSGHVFQIYECEMKCFAQGTPFPSVQAGFKSVISSSTASQQKLRVCEVCGAYLSIFDNDRR